MAVQHKIGYLILSFCFVRFALGGSCQSTPTLQSKNGTIKVPGNPDRYPNNAASCWRIYVPENNVIKLIIHRLDLESCFGCACDSVEVFDGYSESWRSLGKFCSGNRILTSSGRNLFVKFTSDRSVNGDAFTASYYKEAKGPCQSTFALQSSSETIRGPGYPGSYPNNTVRCWRINVPANNVVIFAINSLNMEVCHECSCDSVEVFDGNSESSRSLGKFCSGGSLKRISSGRSLFVKFTSDESNVGDAFTASYHMAAEGSCQSTLTLQSKNGTIKSPGHPDRYSHNAAFCWRIYVPENNVVKLTINRLNLEFCFGCTCDSVEVFDGSSESSRSLGKFCLGNRILTSSGRNLFVKFTSDHSHNGDAFTASYYKEAKGPCQTTFALQSSSETIRGPGYPGSYPNNTVRCWRIIVPANNVVKFTINSLNMEVCHECSCDSVELFDGNSESSRSLGKFCSGESLKRTSSGRSLFVKFTSDESNVGDAFTASYHMVAEDFTGPCQSISIAKSISGTLIGPGYPGRYPNNKVYCWRIHVPANNVVKLTIKSLNMEVCPGCTCDSVEVFDGSSESSKSLGKFCSRGSLLTSSGRYLFVKFTSDASGTGNAFTASYYKKEKDSGSDKDDRSSSSSDNKNKNNNDNSDDYQDLITMRIVKSCIGVGTGMIALITYCCCRYGRN